MQKRITLSIISVAAGLLITSAQASESLSYTLTQIGPVPVQGIGITDVGDINDKGELSISTTTPTGGEVGLWRDGRTHFIGYGGTITDINDRSDIVARVFNPASGVDGAHLWRRDFLQYIGSPSSTSLFTPTEINNKGQIAGYVFDYDVFASRAYITHGDGTFELLTAPSGARSTSAYDLNERGVAIGHSESLVDANIYTDCLMWSDGTVRKLNSEADRHCIPYGINNRNQVVGSLAHLSRGFIWQRGEMQLLPLINEDDWGNSADDINDRGWVVGLTFDNVGEARATLWRRGVAVDLNSLVRADDPLRPFVTLYSAIRINNRGWIVALGTDSRNSGGGAMPYLLTPAH